MSRSLSLRRAIAAGLMIAGVLVSPLPASAQVVPTVPATGLEVEFVQTGRISFSADGAGSNDAVAGATIRVDKPNGVATVDRAFLVCASFSPQIANGDVALNSTGVTFSKGVLNSFFHNVFGDVTAIVKPIVDAAGAGIVNFTLTELVGTTTIDGCALYVIFDDPLQLTVNTIIILFGGQALAGDDFAVTLAEPLAIGDAAEFGLAISFSFQGFLGNSNLCGTGASMDSFIDVNGARVSSCAGGTDDAQGAIQNGTLITVGGIGDDPANPSDPFQRAGDGALPRVEEDELYDLAALLGPTDTLIFVETLNPSNDDNIFAGHILVEAVAIVGPGIVLAPLTATNQVGTSHTVVATLVDDLGSPVVGHQVDFEIVSGPNMGTTGMDFSDINGNASFSYVGQLVAGTDMIVASFVASDESTKPSNTVEKIWVGGDRDADGILDNVDNCPDIPNPGQDNDDPFVDPDGVVGDPDSHGNVCDNCPTVFNEDQADADDNGVGDLCDQGQDLVTEAPLAPVMPGDPTEFLVCLVVNKGEQPLRIPRPNCSLCNFEAIGPDGPVPPRFRTPKGFVIPDDVFTLPPLDPAAPGTNEFEVTCAISDLWAAENLPQDPSGNDVMIDYVATYSTQGIRDPDLDPTTGICSNEPCTAIDDFEVRAIGSFEVASEPVVTTHTAQSCAVDPPTWVQQWEEIGGPVVSTTLAFDSAVDPTNIVVASVRLQFEEPTLPGTESFPNRSLKVGFAGGSAMAALGGTAPGTLFTATVTGEIQFEVDDVPVTEFFTAHCPIQIAEATVVSIDIKPGTFPNTLNLKSNGVLPVAILSSDSFDATQVDPATVTLAESQVRVRGKGNKLLSSTEDVNGDGLMDLMIHIETNSLEVTGQDVRVVLEGRTFSGLRIVGSDSIRVVQE